MYSLKGVYKEYIQVHLKQLTTHWCKGYYLKSGSASKICSGLTCLCQLVYGPPVGLFLPGLPIFPRACPDSLPLVLRVCQQENSSLCPSSLLRTVGWQGTSSLPAGSCFCEGCCEAWAPCHVPGPLPRPWPSCLGWNSILVLGPSDSHMSPEVLMHQLDSVKVWWIPTGCKISR